MRLKITELNFTNQFDWIFKLSDNDGNRFYIMDDSFYNFHKLKSPISRKEIEYFNKGEWIDASAIQINDKNIVINIHF